MREKESEFLIKISTCWIYNIKTSIRFVQIFFFYKNHFFCNLLPSLSPPNSSLMMLCLRITRCITQSFRFERIYKRWSWLDGGFGGEEKRIKNLLIFSSELHSLWEHKKWNFRWLKSNHIHFGSWKIKNILLNLLLTFHATNVFMLAT